MPSWVPDAVIHSALLILARIWEERHRRKKTDTAALRKNIAALREAHSRLERQIKDLYTSFGLGEISRSEYRAVNGWYGSNKGGALPLSGSWHSRIRRTEPCAAVPTHPG